MTTFNTQLNRIETTIGKRITILITVSVILMLVFFLMGVAVGWLVGVKGYGANL